MDKIITIYANLSCVVEDWTRDRKELLEFLEEKKVNYLFIPTDGPLEIEYGMKYIQGNEQIYEFINNLVKDE
jgi:hypothetical protein